MDLVTRLKNLSADALNAPSGIGPLAGDWSDKPHRVVYDCAKALHEAADALEAAKAALKPFARIVPDWDGQPDDKCMIGGAHHKMHVMVRQLRDTARALALIEGGGNATGV